MDAGRSELRFDFQLAIRSAAIRGQAGAEREVELLAYEYRLLDHVDRELLVYHWHPDAAGPDHPHLHVSASLDAQVDALTRREIALDKRHLASGHVSLSAVVSMLITEFGVRPRRSDWQSRLADLTTH